MVGALVVMGQSGEPGLRAWADAEERPIELADRTLLGVAGRPGAGAITLRCEEPLASAGAGTMLVGSLARRARGR